MADIPVVDEYTWARIVAKAYLDTSDFKSKLETDPAAAVSRARIENPGFNIPAAPVRLMSLSYSPEYSEPDSVAKLLKAIFQGCTQAQLQEIFTYGTIGGQLVELPPGEWIPPSQVTRFFQQGTTAISLADWMRIYAYIWHEIRFAGDSTIREDFEEDPAQTLADEIVKPAGPLNITYQKGTTPLFTLAPPSPETTTQLTSIRDTAGALGYRHRIRMSC